MTGRDPSASYFISASHPSSWATATNDCLPGHSLSHSIPYLCGLLMPPTMADLSMTMPPYIPLHPSCNPRSCWTPGPCYPNSSLGEMTPSLPTTQLPSLMPVPGLYFPPSQNTSPCAQQNTRSRPALLPILSSRGGRLRSHINSSLLNRVLPIILYYCSKIK